MCVEMSEIGHNNNTFAWKASANGLHIDTRSNWQTPRSTIVIIIYYFNRWNDIDRVH